MTRRSHLTVRPVTLMVVVVVSALVGGVVGAVVATARETSDPTSDRVAATAASPLRALRPYTPVATGHGVSIAATWTGSYSTLGAVGVLSIKGTITGPWSGAGFLELSLPRSWRAPRGMEAAVINAWFGPQPSLGVHYAMTGVVHPGSTKIRFIAPSPDAASTSWFAVDGVTTPTEFNGGAGRDRRDEFHAVGWVLLDEAAVRANRTG